jgi:hypothetical protein
LHPGIRAPGCHAAAHFLAHAFPYDRRPVSLHWAIANSIVAATATSAIATVIVRAIRPKMDFPSSDFMAFTLHLETKATWSRSPAAIGYRAIRRPKSQRPLGH